MIEDFDLEELEELFAEFEIEASEDGIPDPGPEKYDTKKENSKRELMQQLAFYAEEGPTWDHEGKYLCGSCYYRQLMDSGVAPACYIVEGKISMETGSCQFYRYGNPDSEVNPIPMKEKYTKEAANYAERPKVKGFGCYPRCGYGSVAEGADKDGREIWCGQFGVHVRPKACCAFEDGKDLVQIEGVGTSEGAEKGWDTRGRGRKEEPPSGLLYHGTPRMIASPDVTNSRMLGIFFTPNKSVAQAYAGPSGTVIAVRPKEGSKIIDASGTVENENWHTMPLAEWQSIWNAAKDAGIDMRTVSGYRLDVNEAIPWETFFDVNDGPAAHMPHALVSEMLGKLGYVGVSTHDSQGFAGDIYKRFGQKAYEQARNLNVESVPVTVFFKNDAFDVAGHGKNGIEAGGPGSGCNPEVGKCGRPEGPEKIDYMAEKIGGPQGTNPGGMYKGSDGKYRYVKLYVDPKQSRGEYLANQLYKSLKVPAPDTVLFKKDGKDAIASEQLEGKTVKQMGAISSTQARAFLSGFAADVLTANWDAVGTGMDNVFVDKTGDVYRIDNGGTFLKRAQGGEKPESVLNQITEVKGFFDKNVYYANVAKAAGVTSVKDLGMSTGTKSFVDQVVDIVKLRDNSGGWHFFVEAKVPDMPPDEQNKIAGMIEARTSLMQSLALGIGKTPEQTTTGTPAEKDKTPSKARDWSTPDQKLVGGYFRQGTVLAQVYTRLSSNEGQWQKISEIKKDLETKIGKSLYNISQNTLKQGGKKSGLWQLEISGDSIRMYITKPGEKTQVADIGEDKQKIAADFAKQMMSSMQTAKFPGFFQQMGVSDESRKSFENAVKSWTGSADSVAAQNWREVAMNFYGRKPDGDHVGYNAKVMGTPMSAQKAKAMEPAALAMKAYAGEYAKINNLNVVYRNIDSPQAHDILVAMREAKASGLTQIKVNLNSLSCWSDKPNLYISSGVKLRMKIDPDNVWAAHNSSPYLFSAHPGEHEFMIGSHQAQEIFDFKDISIDDKYDTQATQQEYNEWHKDFMNAQADKLDPRKDQAFYKALKKAQKESKIPIANCVLDDHWMYKKKKP